MAVTQKLACTVDRIVHHGGRVYTLVLRPERRAPRFQPGQFLHLAIDSYDATGFWPESRVFSIASSPSESTRLSITYSVVGRFTARMEAELREGCRAWIKLPYGEFVVSPVTDVVLFAGGTGVTAFTAFLEGAEASTNKSICLAYGARSKGLLIYRDLVRRCACKLPRLDVSYFVEDVSGGVHGSSVGSLGDNEREEPGRISVAAVWPRILAPKEANYYISGPPPMLSSVAQDLRDRGIVSEAIHIDAWE